MKLKTFFKVADNGVYLITIPGLLQKQVVKVVPKGGSHREIPKVIETIQDRFINKVYATKYEWNGIVYPGIQLELKLTKDEKLYLKKIKEKVDLEKIKKVIKTEETK